MKNYIASVAIIILLMLTPACSFIKGLTEPGRQEAKLTNGVAVTQYSADSLYNYKVARNYAAQGRYELAREHYLLALASANDPNLQEVLAGELESVDMMIKSLR